MDAASKSKVIAYYHRCIQNNKLYWNLDKCKAIHAGYWDETTQTLEQALNRENEVAAKAASIQPGENVLDVGCGVGGGAIYLAKKIGCHVLGIDIGEEMITEARKNAREEKVEDLVNFCEMDSNDIRLEKDAYDVVWMMESFCHVEDKPKFIRDIFHLLRRGGRLLIADGFCVKEEYSIGEKKLLESMYETFGSGGYMGVKEMLRCLEGGGYEDIEYEEVTEHVKPSARRLYYYGIPLMIWSYIGEYVGWSTRERTQDFRGYMDQYRPLKAGLVGYGILSAKKPRH
jgi:tocopherol O-methyltransferase